MFRKNRYVSLTNPCRFEKIIKSRLIGESIEVNLMLSDKIKLTAKDILEKDFKTAMRGYKPEDVDQFLDLIIKGL